MRGILCISLPGIHIITTTEELVKATFNVFNVLLLQLEDGHTLFDYDVGLNDIIQLMVRPIMTQAMPPPVRAVPPPAPPQAGTSTTCKNGTENGNGVASGSEEDCMDTVRTLVCGCASVSFASLQASNHTPFLSRYSYSACNLPRTPLIETSPISLHNVS